VVIWKLRKGWQIPAGKFEGGRLVNNHYKLLVVDIDGTLVGRDRSISAEDREALAKVRDLGIQVSLSTGRAVKASLGIINQLSLDGYHIFCDGALVSNPGQGKEVYVQPISREVVKQMVEFAHQHEIDLELHSVTHYFVERETWSTEARRQFFGIEPTIGDLTGLWERERIIKGGVVTATPQEAAKARNWKGELPHRSESSSLDQVHRWYKETCQKFFH